MQSYRLSACVLVLFGCVAVLAGCGDGRPKRVPVSGRVLIDDKPLTSGFIRVVPAGDKTATGEIGPDGRFTLTTFDKNDGCVLGTHPIAIIASRKVGGNEVEYLVPEKYEEATTSGKTVTINGPEDDLVIKLSWEGGKPFRKKQASSGDMDFSKM